MTSSQYIVEILHRNRFEIVQRKWRESERVGECDSLLGESDWGGATRQNESSASWSHCMIHTVTALSACFHFHSLHKPQ